MKTTFIMNGSTKLILTPETEAEEIMLKSLSKQDNVISLVGDNSHVAMTYGEDSLIIMKSDNAASQAQEV